MQTAHNVTRFCLYAAIVLSMVALTACSQDPEDATTDMEPGGENGPDCPGDEGCSCNDEFFPCDVGLSCVQGLCSPCQAGGLGCECAGGSCEAGVCDASNTCRDVFKCSELECVAQQKCLGATATQDAECLAECEQGWVWDSVKQACEQGQANCETDPSAPDYSKSLVPGCQDRNRACAVTADGAKCTECVAGHVESAEGRCEPLVTCDALVCTGRTCIEATNTSPASCGPCEPGRVPVNDTTCKLKDCDDITCGQGETCIAASDTEPARCMTSSDVCPSEPQPLCTGERGATGRYSPAKSEEQNKCVCETLPGFYLDANFEIQPCDEDEDGFIREEAFDAIQNRDSGTGDIVRRENARCLLRRITNVELRQEDGQVLRKSAKDVFDLDALPLYESQFNDSKSQAMPYGTGRDMQARERNSFTKACSEDGTTGRSADFNGNNVPDAREWHGIELAALEANSQRVNTTELLSIYRGYAKLSYFLELYEGWFEASGPSVPNVSQDGTWIIRERRRDGAGSADSELALTYAQGEHWRQCTRRPDTLASNPAVSHKIGLDFAQYRATSSWDAMLHSSQFKCVEVVTAGAYESEQSPGTNKPYLVTPEILDEQDVRLPRATPESSRIAMPADMNLCELDMVAPSTRGNIDNPNDTSFTCVNAVSANASSVGFASVRFMSYETRDDYSRGCVDECTEVTPVSMMCMAQERSCTPSSEGAVCEGCLPGFEDLGGGCVPVKTCLELDCKLRTCTAETDNSSATCDACDIGFIEISETACAKIESNYLSASLSTCGVGSMGDLKCWGENFYGQLGDGTETAQLIPTKTIGLPLNMKQVSSGSAHTCAVSSLGDVWCWGRNAFGQLGGGTPSFFDNQLTPIKVTGLSLGAEQVSVGTAHSCAIDQAGGVKCWGLNVEGELGNGTNFASTNPVSVVGLASGTKQISIGQSFSCALTAAGGVKCWGSNSSGQLGNGTTVASSQPVDVMGLSSGVAQIDVDSDSVFALMLTGDLMAWGGGNLMPVSIPMSGDRIESISLGRGHFCFITNKGALKCLGYNGYGQLGDGTLADSNVPVDVIGMGSNVVAVSAGELHTCARTSNGSVYCWGRNSVGQIGIGTRIDQLTPALVPGF